MTLPDQTRYSFRSSRPNGKQNVDLCYGVFPVNEEKGAIVISSGRTESFAIYGEVIRDLNGQKYSVYIHDHRGQGCSTRLLEDGDRVHVVDFEDYVSDLHQFITTVVKPESHRHIFLLAHSMGGGIAARYLEQHPDVFKAAALVTPMLKPILGYRSTTTLVSFLNRHIPWADDGDFAHFQSKAYRASATTDITQSEPRWLATRAIYADAYSANGKTNDHRPALGGVTHRWIREAYAAAELARKKARDVKTPVLILQASEDTAVDPDAQVEFCRGIGNGKCEGYVIQGAQHALFIEKDRYRTMALTKVLDFFDTNSRG